jgi:hypothetical protein
MKFLRRKVRGRETVREEGRVIHREIEITVEREWLSVPSRGQPERNTETAGAQPVEMQILESPVLELPLMTEPE